MRENDGLLMLAGGVILVVVVAALGVGMLGTTVTSSEGPSRELPAPPEDGSAGVVWDLRTIEGTSILGIKLQRDRREAHVAMVVNEECVRVSESGDEELAGGGACENLPARGEVVGGGTTEAGSRLVIVRVDVGRQCYEALTVGVAWPVSDRSCLDAA